MEHEELRRLLDGEQAHWWASMMACRLNDMRKVDSRWHATVFEMLVAVTAAQRNEQPVWHLSGETCSFLFQALALDPARLVVSYCAGGEILPGLIIEEEPAWREAWILAGVSESNMIPVRGPKNYLLFVAPGERVGPKFELLYWSDSAQRHVEIGTAILDTGTLVQDVALWRIEPSRNAVRGVAFGLGRLAAAATGASDIAAFEPTATLLRLVRDQTRQPASTWPWLFSDAVILIDQLHACVHLIADVEPSSPLARHVHTMAARVRRKIAVLDIPAWRTLVDEIEARIIEHYVGRYAHLRNRRGTLRALLERLPWPETWNPDSYVGS